MWALYLHTCHLAYLQTPKNEKGLKGYADYPMIVPAVVESAQNGGGIDLKNV
jgi:hypothetical protein